MMKTNSVCWGSGSVANISSRWSREAFPATLTSGLGLLQVCGRMRVPQPAIGMMIFRVSDKSVLLCGMQLILLYDVVERRRTMDDGRREMPSLSSVVRGLSSIYRYTRN